VVVIADSREGWVNSFLDVLKSHFEGTEGVDFDFSLIREKGAPIKGFGGTSSGPDPLSDLLSAVDSLLSSQAGSLITITTIVDIMNLIGKCVVSGNIRRTAEISFGDPLSDEYLDLKNYDVNPQRCEYGWSSNNSVYAERGMDYDNIAKRVCDNGEPGFAWLDNMKMYGRMNGEVDYRDYRAEGGNPCLEQTLESFELCCLVETFPNRHESREDYMQTLKCAYLYAKTVTLGQTQWPETNKVLLRNRRIGCSISGVAQFLSHRGIEELRQWLNEGYDAVQEYDEQFSEWLCIPRSIKTTSVKPSGTVSLLAGATPGMHFPESRFYIRRVRLSDDSNLLPPLRSAGYHVEKAIHEPNTMIVEVPVDVGEKARTLKEVGMWEQLSLAAFLQKHWADNQVSCTVSFDPKTEGPQLATALEYFQYQLKGVSFLPRHDVAAYDQMPYEEIDENTYKQKVSLLRPLVFGDEGDEAIPDRFCDSDTCTPT